VLLGLSSLRQLSQCVHGFAEKRRVPGELGGHGKGVAGGAGPQGADIKLGCQVKNLLQHQSLFSPIRPTLIMRTFGRSGVEILHVDSPQLPLDGVLMESSVRVFTSADVTLAIKIIIILKSFIHDCLVPKAWKSGEIADSDLLSFGDVLDCPDLHSQLRFFVLSTEFGHSSSECIRGTRMVEDWMNQETGLLGIRIGSRTDSETVIEKDFSFIQTIFASSDKIHHLVNRLAGL